MKKKKLKKEVSGGELKELIEKLAVSTADGFVHMEKQLDEKLDIKISGLEKRLSQRITGLENRIDGLALERATKEEVKILSLRIDRLELRTGVKHR